MIREEGVERPERWIAASSALLGSACRRTSRSSVRTPDRAIEAKVATDETISKTTRFEVRQLL